MGLIKKWLTERPLTNWLRRTLRNLLILLDPLIDHFGRLAAFWAPRLCDRLFLSMVLTNGAFLLGIQAAPDHLERIAIVLALIANLLAPLWDDLPKEGLRPPAHGPAMGPGATEERVRTWE